MDTNPILFVDDEPNVLEGLRRTLYDQFDVHTAGSGAAALEMCERAGPFAVVVSDMRMPSMDGAELLSSIKRLAPDTTRILLTGYSDIEAAVRAINEGQIFRFLSKPCPKEQLVRTLKDGLAQYRLVTGERALLENTLNGAVELLVQVLNLTAPIAFTQAKGVRACVAHLVRGLGLSEPWRFDLAALLYQLGYVAVPHSVLEKLERGATLDAKERQVLEGHPDVAHKLLSNIPRLGDVAEVVRAQRDAAYQVLRDPELRKGANSLRLAVQLSTRVHSGVSLDAAIDELRETDLFCCELLDALKGFQFEHRRTCSKQVPIAELLPGMILEADVLTPQGAVVVPHGREVTTALIERLRNFARGLGVQEPIHVLVAD